MAREWKEAARVMEEYLPIVRKFGDPVFTLTAEVYYNIALSFLGDQKAIEKAIQLINTCFDIGFKAFASTLSPFIGEKYFQIGDYDAALNWIEKILGHVNQTGSHTRTAELYRLKGLVLGALGKPGDIVEEYLIKAIKLANKQSARVFELRATVDLARLWKKHGKAEKGYEMLKETLKGFKEGHDSAELLEAREVLESCK
jgi:tetratricopeptide (TPR) repeat protein